jgi:predicted NBD/HSP70 family sugar kinase
VRIDGRSVGALAIEIFVDEVGASVVALDGAVVSTVRLARTRDRVTLDSTIADIVVILDQLDQRVGDDDGRRLLGCGVSVPGLVRDIDGAVVVAPNLGWVDVALADAIADVLDQDLAISIGNDADLGALAESRFGAGVGSDQMVYISGEVGVGGGLVSGGRQIVGTHGFAGEIGHLPVNPDGHLCRCGSVGCWETEVGEPALLGRAGLDPDGGRAAVDEFLERSDAGDPAVIDALAAEARWLAIGIAGLVNVLDPDTVVLGGLFARILPAIRASLDDELALRRYRSVPRDVAVVGAALGARAVTVGAAESAFASLLADPAGVMGGTLP